MTEFASPFMLAYDPKLKAFLASALFVLPWLVYQAYVLGTSFRQRRGKPVADTNALADGAAKLQAAAKAAKTWGVETPADAAGTGAVDGAASAPSEPPASPAPAPSSSPALGGRTLLFLGATAFLSSFAKAWLARVLTKVPEPYLDEFFHVPQAQKYCRRQWYDWDDKITTPPGLYLVSVAMETMWSGLQNGCDIWALRGANTVAIMLVALTASACRAAFERQRNTSTVAAWPGYQSAMSFYALHTGFNVALLPVLFFFSALYYTDVYSTLAVLLAYRLHLFRVSVPALEPLPVWSDILAVLVGFATLAMRQTNIFWVVVYLGGLEVVQAAKAVRQQPANKAALLAAQDETFDSLPNMVRLYLWRYSRGDVHDPSLATSWPDDWVLSLLSVAVAAVSNPLVMLQRAWPYAAVLGGFAQFVVWNGGVVLGDKANHVATIHAAQLLYLWPLLAFFSAPLFVTHGLYYAGVAWTMVAGGKTAAGTKNDDEAASEAAPALTEAAFPEGEDTKDGPKLPRLLHVVAVNKAYYPVYLVVVFDAMLAVVYWNTLIHPFTLADNRHYMFYVFRYTIRRGALVRYALVPVYALTGWACWRILWLGLGGSKTKKNDGTVTAAAAGEYISSPFASGQTAFAPVESEEDGATSTAIEDNSNKKKQARQRREKVSSKKAKSGKGKQAAANKAGTEEDEVLVAVTEDTGPQGVFLGFLDEDEDGAATASRTGPTTTTALLWLLATSLSLVTAPLVEPRYFILPWVLWRLLVPAAKDAAPTPEQKKTRSLAASLLSKLDVRLLLETAWFVAINAATMYIFLEHPYQWRATDGSLMDGGRLQRFMW
ncbi:glucosyltransferase [Sporothrix curviconia]|uniref:Dol-P-Glc:Glc(2)Man(9)GlcNAc(2)-PP-Dol alpha-1,2-glucosyltransferase n=1 Tax=Sporothrix curviconia TaxID=1260050 RepID=A0ABP0AWP5_9PEZI